MAIDSHSELLKVVNDLDAMMGRSREEDIRSSLTRLWNACVEIRKVWSGSCLGYHAQVYRNKFQPLSRDRPFGNSFDARKGLASYSSSYGYKSWVEYDRDSIRMKILEQAGNLELGSINTFNSEAERTFNDYKHDLLSLIDIEMRNTPSTFLETMKDRTLSLSVKTLKDVSEESFARIKVSPSQDKRALAEGKQLPMHWIFMNFVTSTNGMLEAIPKLSEVASQTARHIARERSHLRQRSAGSKVFIGHGSSSAWRELKEFIQERLELQTDEFNRITVAGYSNKERLSEMLDEASIAFLIMTGEDEQPDGESRARENVVHEVGLFQGRLGFERAIVLLEDGCEEFSNITGLGQIRFPKGGIKAAFEEIRQVCEREGLLQS